jgi:hypothetical protein
MTGLSKNQTDCASFPANFPDVTVTVDSVLAIPLIITELSLHVTASSLDSLALLPAVVLGYNTYGESELPVSGGGLRRAGAAPICRSRPAQSPSVHVPPRLKHAVVYRARLLAC